MMTLVHSLRAEDGAPLDLKLVLEADQPPSVGDYVTFGTDSRLTLQVVEREWAPDLRSVTVHLRDSDVSGPLTEDQRRAALAAAGWSRTVALPR